MPGAAGICLSPGRDLGDFIGMFLITKRLFSTIDKEELKAAQRAQCIVFGYGGISDQYELEHVAREVRK